MNMAHQETFTLFKKADIEDYLEKTNSGITAKWLPGKTRMWCELYGSILYIFKGSKSHGKIRSRSSSEAQQIDMSQVHMVHKTAADKTGAQFEIFSKNKQHTFCASTVAECDNWVRQLQTAMTLNPQDQGRSDRSAALDGDYETIEVFAEDEPTTPRIKIGASSTLDPGYSEVEFQNPPASPQTNATASAGLCQSGGDVGEDGYATVEFRSNPGSDQPVAQPGPKSKDSSQPQPASPAGKSVMKVDSYGYAIVELRKKSVSDQFQLPEAAATTEAEVGQGDSYGYASVQRKTAPGTPMTKSDNTPGTTANGESEGSSDEDDSLIAAAQREPDPVPPFPHPLVPEDLEPLAALQDFLSANQKLCRPSFSDKMVSENPVDDMKQLLAELHL